jgi:hypothetical protein
MPRTQAYLNFRATLPMAVGLMQQERQYQDPPSPEQQSIVRGLRGGAAVLMVAAFEAFLDDMIEEHVETAANRLPKIDHDKLPVGMRVHDIYSSLEGAMKGPKHAPQGERVDRISAIRQVSALVTAKSLNPSAFRGTAGNPGKKSLKELLKRVGLDDAFAELEDRFARHWGNAFAANLIGDKLDEIVQRRHRVAHRADALTISRGDLKEAERFLRVFAEVLDIEVGIHMRKVCRIAR